MQYEEFSAGKTAAGAAGFAAATLWVLAALTTYGVIVFFKALEG